MILQLCPWTTRIGNFHEGARTIAHGDVSWKKCEGFATLWTDLFILLSLAAYSHMLQLMHAKTLGGTAARHGSTRCTPTLTKSQIFHRQHNR